LHLYFSNNTSSSSQTIPVKYITFWETKQFSVNRHCSDLKIV